VFCIDVFFCVVKSLKNINIGSWFNVLLFFPCWLHRSKVSINPTVLLTLRLQGFLNLTFLSCYIFDRKLICGSSLLKFL
jgi:hypothetical protein